MSILSDSCATVAADLLCNQQSSLLIDHWPQINQLHLIKHCHTASAIENRNIGNSQGLCFQTKILCGRILPTG